MRSKLTYNVYRKDFDEDTGKYDSVIDYRDTSIEIYGKTEEEAKANFDSFETYLTNNSSYEGSSCPSIEEIYSKNIWCYSEMIGVDNKDEFEEVKEIYKEWKASLKSTKTIKVKKVESSNSNQIPVNDVPEEVTDVQPTTVENTQVNTASENSSHVTDQQTTCSDNNDTNTNDSTQTPNYRIYQNVIDLKGTQLQVGQKYRIDLLNSTTINEVTELSNLNWIEFTEGYNDGTTNTIYIEITEQKDESVKSQSSNSNNKKLHDQNVISNNIYIDSDNELVIERLNSTYGQLYNQLHSRVKHIKRGLFDYKF